jgi:ASC-1-like (ASCH) protein
MMRERIHAAGGRVESRGGQRRARCADAKRLAIEVGSLIRFTCGERTLSVRATRVAHYDSFESPYEAEDAVAINPYRSRAEQLAGIEALYGPEKRALGAVAIEIEVPALS